MCGREVGKMDTSHIYHKDCSALRWNMTNGLLKCVRCHKYGKLAWHSSALSAALKYIRKYPARAEYLKGFEDREELEKDWTLEELLEVENFLREKLAEINS
jgi:hypothetical protein